jgi:hypothetical protein
MATRKASSSSSGRGSSGGSSRGGNRGGNKGGSRGGNRGGNNGGGFPSWGLYALGGLAIAGIIYGLSKYGPTSETINSWVDSATGFVGGSDDDVDEYGADDFDEEDEGTTNATGSGSSAGYGGVQ